MLEQSWAICPRLARSNFERLSRLRIPHSLRRRSLTPTGVIFIRNSPPLSRDLVEKESLLGEMDYALFP